MRWRVTTGCDAAPHWRGTFVSRFVAHPGLAAPDREPPARTIERLLFPLAAILIGAAVGIGSFTFVYAKGASYLTDDPAACANCHVMEAQYAGWVKSSHRDVAGCNDCHTPHNYVGKYVTKARNGFWHSFYFTTGTFPDPIRIRPPNRTITEGACRDCHTAIAESIHAEEVPRFDAASTLRSEGGTLACTRCHSDVGHWTP